MQTGPAFFDAAYFSSDEILELFSMQTFLGTWRFSCNGGAGLVSSNICKILEFSPEREVASLEGLMKNVHPDDQVMLHACIAQAVASGTAMECVYRVFRPEGHTKHVRSVGRVRTNSNGEQEIFGVTYEVHEAIRSIVYVD